MPKQQRIRDPLHDIIDFNVDEVHLERVLWRVIQTRPFQRLRRVKQLGFSDFVYPGATHSRLLHSLGVFHTARYLMDVVRKYTHPFEPTKADQALAAALVHDVGHGPFSHAFEDVGRRLGLKLADHELVSEILIRDGEIAEEFKELGSGFADDVADTALFLFLARIGTSDAWSETARRKPEKAANGRLDRARTLYEQIRQIQTPTPLPQLG
jgi:HD superfamily phosphohydrolase